MKTAFVLMASIIAFSTLGRADAKYDRCMKTAESTLAMTECEAARSDRAEANVKKAYEAVKAHLTSTFDGADRVEAIRRLDAAQNAWTAFRAAQCELAGVDMLGGSGERVIIGGCYGDSAESRAKVLMKLIPAL